MHPGERFEVVNPGGLAEFELHTVAIDLLGDESPSASRSDVSFARTHQYFPS